ncbi:MAG: 2,3-bisphosphoglycerate-independent phosphoglycerate mutase [Patescibacteria group bacterium]|nr:2,3-bisphosphoglycerate-independent phosphoglycerate mutase [Patescibacteria group bacterium]MCL5224173.1 2,3-bisphosphoglycerate-independent phosphoglycerate mutase [Patescibacteria group bacterium]
MNRRTVVMVILDGWGIGRKDGSNPIHIAKPPTIDWIKHNHYSGSLQASGIAVGLPWEEEGNSEVGHLTLGAGRVIYQSFPRITLAIRNGTFYKNPMLLAALRHGTDNNSRIHLVGLLSSGHVHSSMEHLQALVRLVKSEGIANERLNLHLFTDGIDSPPKSAIDLLNKLLADNPGLRIASVCGRYFAMDRDFHTDRTEKAYNALTGSPAANRPTGKNAAQYITSFYAGGLTDEFVEPALLLEDGTIQKGDSAIFFNFREDSMRQLTEMFVNAELPDVLLTTFTNYSQKFSLPVAFPQEVIDNPLGKVLSDNGRVQLRLAESERYAHVTYYFNGYREPPFKNEYRAVIPSRTTARPEEFPELMAPEITARAISAISERVYDFILINYANPDLMAHTGNFDAALKAIEVVDSQIAELVKAVYATGAVMVVTSDHGNIERMIDPLTGVIETKHDDSPVPIYIVAKDWERLRDDFDVESGEKESAGVLSDVAPSILEILGLPQPAEMSGVSLLKLLV